MSDSNLDFSGLFNGGGGFTLDPTKFDFSGYNPEPEKKTVSSGWIDADADSSDSDGSSSSSSSSSSRRTSSSNSR